MKIGDKKYICENKRWRIDTTYYFGDGTSKRLNKKWFDSKSDAIAYYNDWEKKIVAEHDLTGDLSFEDFVYQWSDFRTTQVRISTTFTCDKPILNLYITPYCKGKTVNEAFEQNNILKIYANIKSHDCSIGRKNAAINILHNMIDYAYNTLLIGDRVHQLAIVRTPKLKKELGQNIEVENRQPWTDEETQKFLESVGIGTRNEIMFRLFISFAMRLGEFLALKPCDIDLSRRIVTVSHQIVYAGYERPVDTTILKSANSYRQFPISEKDANTLEEWIKAFGIGKDEYLFKAVDSKNTPYSKTSFRRAWKNACDKAGIRYMCPHGARHMKAVKLLSKCENLSDQAMISKLLGHTPSVDLNTYANHGDMDKAKKLLEL